MAIIWTEKIGRGRGENIPSGTDVHITLSKSSEKPHIRVSFYDWAMNKYNKKCINVGYDPDKPNRLYFIEVPTASDGYSCSDANTCTTAKIPIRVINSAFGETVRPNDLVGNYPLRTDVALKLNYIEFKR